MTRCSRHMRYALLPLMLFCFQVLAAPLLGCAIADEQAQPGHGNLQPETMQAMHAQHEGNDLHAGHAGGNSQGSHDMNAQPLAKHANQHDCDCGDFCGICLHSFNLVSEQGLAYSGLITRTAPATGISRYPFTAPESPFKPPIIT